MAEIAGAGLNWICPHILDDREVERREGGQVGRDGREAVPRAYVLDWARKYGIRVTLDLHTMPGSQNGCDHPGNIRSINRLKLSRVRIITEFISQPEWRDVIPMFDKSTSLTCA